MDAQWWTPTTVRHPLTAPTHPTAVLSGTATAKKFWFERQWQPTVAAHGASHAGIQRARPPHPHTQGIPRRLLHLRCGGARRRAAGWARSARKYTQLTVGRENGPQASAWKGDRPPTADHKRPTRTFSLESDRERGEASRGRRFAELSSVA